MNRITIDQTVRMQLENGKYCLFIEDQKFPRFKGKSKCKHFNEFIDDKTQEEILLNIAQIDELPSFFETNAPERLFKEGFISAAEAKARQIANQNNLNSLHEGRVEE